MKVDKWKWFGKAAHLCVSDRCLFHMATDVGRYVISTVGAYYPNMNRHGEGLGAIEEVGLGRKYETYVFKKNDGKGCDCGCGLPSFGLGEVDSMAANDDGEATKNHMIMCKTYASKR